jgi:hypothetical protein
MYRTYPKYLHKFNRDIVCLANNLIPENDPTNIAIQYDIFLSHNIKEIIKILPITNKCKPFETFLRKYYQELNIEERKHEIDSRFFMLNNGFLRHERIKLDMELYQAAKKEFYKTFNKELVLYKLCGSFTYGEK